MNLPANPSESFKRLNSHLYGKQDNAGGQASGAKPEQAVRHGPVVKAEGKEKNSACFSVRVTSYRSRLLDPDNLCPKYFIDCLRYAGLIKDDRSQDIVLEVSQQKVATKEEEHTRIEIEPIA